ncbi:hypothetical protein SY87_03675 [Burkholderia pseudomallei]|uniref:hypothetical protein n=1 Tax=Burkholderia pseudomallei TaxID=28450 RepID=UPI0005C7F000|nr:hypothetical protein [Burkholderia pseudomallei]KIX49593.1 hypothetical protein SY87_03675 [Burkholderia pseudomallei]
MTARAAAATRLAHPRTGGADEASARFSSRASRAAEGAGWRAAWRALRNRSFHPPQGECQIRRAMRREAQRSPAGLSSKTPRASGRAHRA